MYRGIRASAKPSIAIAMDNLLPSPVGSILFSTSQQRILGLMYAHPWRKFTTRDLTVGSTLSRTTIVSVVRELERHSLITTSTCDGQVLYGANHSHSLFDDLTPLAHSFLGTPEIVKQALTVLEPYINLAVLYGPCAAPLPADCGAPGSTNLFVVSNTLQWADIIEVLRRSEEILGQQINVSVFTPCEYESYRQSGDHFLSRVMAGDFKVLYQLFNNAQG